MAPGTTLEPTGSLTADACRRFFQQRGDASLGLVPQLLLDERQADTWAFFWYAARLVDDEIEARKSTGADYAKRLADGTRSTPAEEALHRALAMMPAHIGAAQLKRDLATALAALDRERARPGHPAMADYARDTRDKAGVPLFLLNRLLLPGEDVAAVQRFSLLMAMSIQLGDDVRDAHRDHAQGLVTTSAEEHQRATTDSPTDPAGLVAKWRESAAKWLAILGLERADRFTVPDNRQRGRTEALLWISAIDQGQLRAPSHPLKWPQPLGDLVAMGPPSSARMAAGRRVLHNEPTVLGEARRWDSTKRLAEAQRLRQTLPDFYATLEAAARV